MIRITPIRVIGPDNEQIGVIETAEALRMAQEQGLDLVEISPEVRPPVCKIMDYGKHKYELSKKQQKSRASSKSTELKEIRLGRSVKIDPHDVQIRVDQSRRFLMAGHKVQITQRFRGREMAHKELGIERLASICEQLSDIAKVEVPPRWMGRQASIIVAPDRQKVEAAKRKMTKEQLEKEAEELRKLEAQNLAEIEADDSRGDDDDDSGGHEKGRKRGPADDRAINPLDAEIADLLGE
ncbi:MAG: translation initiation factor IF-3 [Leptolyngbya sp. PLA3]|nr:MAG: translation initiation factor IF-3 [Cyanobacteria bacterium CYA]MCE7968606.1 translation initiation factor IF-3 [Leptolyngbya sp. PL-A3]